MQVTFMTGYGVSAVHGLPDTQLMSYGEMVAAARVVTAALKQIPCIGDGDTGYGGLPNIERTQNGAAAP
jgi:2-methylisocitrate lyase-like PEP mutase family enzyme